MSISSSAETFAMPFAMASVLVTMSWSTAHGFGDYLHACRRLRLRCPVPVVSDLSTEASTGSCRLTGDVHVRDECSPGVEAFEEEEHDGQDEAEFNQGLSAFSPGFGS